MVYVLSFHAGYRCRHAGVCCTSGWTIPVEAPLFQTLEAAVAWGHVRVPGHSTPDDLFEPIDDLPGGEPAILKHQPNGACVFFEPSRGNLCAIQRQTDHAHLPSACRHFPRVPVLDPRGTFITLSHVCPTAARMLLVDGPAAVVSGASGFDPHVHWEGLDARDALPPLLRADMLWDWDAWDRWERGAVAMLGSGRSPERSLAQLSNAADRVAAWQPSWDISLGEEVDASLADLAAPGEPLTPHIVRELKALAHANVPMPLRSDADARTPVEAALVEIPGWEAWHGAIGRYLAAHAFANRVAYHGQSIRTWYASILSAYAVLRVACARAVEQSGRALDAEMLVAALGEADNLLVHRVSTVEFANALDEWLGPGPRTTRGDQAP